MCIDLVEICFGIANGQISSIFDSYLPAIRLYFTCRTITRVNLNGFSPNLICAFILWRSALGLLIGKFCQFLTELSARNLIMAGYYRFTFYFSIKTCCGYSLEALTEVLLMSTIEALHGVASNEYQQHVF